MTDHDEERIESAAIRVQGKVFTLPPPARHHNVMRMMYEDHGFRELIGEEQGFVTSYGRFVDRRMAGILALRAKQTAALKWPNELYSEDLW